MNQLNPEPSQAEFRKGRCEYAGPGLLEVGSTRARDVEVGGCIRVYDAVLRTSDRELVESKKKATGAAKSSVKTKKADGGGAKKKGGAGNKKGVSEKGAVKKGGVKKGAVKKGGKK